MRALTTQGPRPTIEIDWYKSVGVYVKNLKTEEIIVVPWTNIIEIVCEGNTVKAV
jgi:hypothetical protein